MGGVEKKRLHWDSVNAPTNALKLPWVLRQGAAMLYTHWQPNTAHSWQLKGTASHAMQSDKITKIASLATVTESYWDDWNTASADLYIGIDTHSMWASCTLEKCLNIWYRFYAFHRSGKLLIIFRIIIVKHCTLRHYFMRQDCIRPILKTLCFLSYLVCWLLWTKRGFLCYFTRVIRLFNNQLSFKQPKMDARWENTPYIERDVVQ